MKPAISAASATSPTPPSPKLVADHDRAEHALCAAVEQVVEQRLQDQQPQPGVPHHLGGRPRAGRRASTAGRRRRGYWGTRISAKQTAATAKVSASTAIAQPGPDRGDEQPAEGVADDRAVVWRSRRSATRAESAPRHRLLGHRQRRRAR